MIIIPMAGLSSRFAAAGYKLPKYMLPLRGRSVFSHAVGSFAKLFSETPFLFVAREIDGTEIFIKQECDLLGIADARVVILDRETSGQAETVEMGLAAANESDNEPVTIFNIDTFRSDFEFPTADWFARSDGYLEVFMDQGKNWSYAAPSMDTDEPIVLKTAEKQPISDLCCNGLYHFARQKDFREALYKERVQPQSAELYVAPLYNHLISSGYRIHYNLIEKEKITFCGVPFEYEALR